LKDRDAAFVALLASNYYVAKATGKRRVRLTVILGPRQRGGDPDAYHLSLLDALVRAGLLVDDSKEYVELEPTHYVRETKPGCVIVLEDLD
jgi:hypothetical protein